MTPERAFLATIIAKPADNQPRLSYADWLEENGQTERAEFIRLQLGMGIGASLAIRTARIYATDNFQATPKTHRMTMLLDEFADVWCAQIGVTATDAWEWIWQGGFITEVSCTEEQWVGKRCGKCVGHPGCVPVNQWSTKRCPDCHGTGHVEGIGQRIARTHPVERVVTEKRPLGPSLFTWFRGHPSRLDPESNINEEIFDLLTGHYGRANLRKFYYTEQAALDAYSRAAIELFRPKQP